MTEAWNDRKKALEEDYFRKKEQEAIEKLRAKRAAAGAAAAPKCPKCEGTLMEISYDEVDIDRCTQCGGVWLDPGELERLTKQEDSSGFLGRLFKNLSGDR